MGVHEPEASALSERIGVVARSIAEAAERCGRRPGDVRLCAVTKNVPASRVRDAWDAGLRLFGENRVQEARDKIPLAPPGLEWHLVGHLQTNKAREAVRLFACVQSVDSPRVAEALHRRMPAEGRKLPILIEVNCSGEGSKYGVAPDELPRLIDHVLQLDRVELRGLMTIGPLSPSMDDARRSFALLRTLRERAESLAGCSLPELSMGMSGDYPAAIEEGATLVRIGTAIFGERRIP